jgi:hypothetical protein
MVGGGVTGDGALEGSIVPEWSNVGTQLEILMQ